LVVLVIETDVDLRKADLAVEAVGRLATFRHPGAGLVADVRDFIKRMEDGPPRHPMRAECSSALY
jgi:hypothetical protein